MHGRGVAWVARVKQKLFLVRARIRQVCLPLPAELAQAAPCFKRVAFAYFLRSAEGRAAPSVKPLRVKALPPASARMAVPTTLPGTAFWKGVHMADAVAVVVGMAGNVRVPASSPS